MKMCDQLGRPESGAVSCRKLGGVETAVVLDDRVSIRNLKRLGAGFIVAAIGLISAQPMLSATTAVPLIPIQTSTIPSNGDLNPYGVAFVPNGFPTGGNTAAGDVLVSNFNASSNVQGTGSTIVSVTPAGVQSLFFQGATANGPYGLSTALGVLKKGFVIVGNVPNVSGTVEAGSLIIIDKNGNQVGSQLTDPNLLDGPWDLAIVDNGDSALLFVSCVLNGTVTRLNLAVTDTTVTVTSKTQIGWGYAWKFNKAALVVGPTGLAYDPKTDLLYVASTKDNKIFSIPNAGKTTTCIGTGSVVYKDKTHLHGPLGLVLAPNGDLISSQGDAINPNPALQSEIVEFTTTGTFVTEFALDSTAGAAFGIAVSPPSDGGVKFAAINDTLNTVIAYDLNGR
jgi:hypothetical protein